MTNQNKSESTSESLGFEDMSPDDPNYVHLDKLKEMEKLFQEMPEGWSHNKDWKKTKAPYVHVSGKVSFRHPNRPKMDEIVKEMREAGKENQDVSQKRDADNTPRHQSTGVGPSVAHVILELVEQTQVKKDQNQGDGTRHIPD